VHYELQRGRTQKGRKKHEEKKNPKTSGLKVRREKTRAGSEKAQDADSGQRRVTERSQQHIRRDAQLSRTWEKED